MSKDVIIAGALAVGCVALIAAAFLLPKSKPAEEPAKTEVIATEPVAADPLALPVAGPGDAGTAAFTAPGLPMSPGVPGASVGGQTAPSVSPFPTATNQQPFGAPAPGQQFGSTPASPAPVIEAAPAPVATEAKTHTVANGELLGDIALKYYGNSKAWKKIAAANPGLDPKHLKVGQKLVIPADDAKSSATVAAGSSAGAGDRSYTVKAGDTYYSIAKKELGSAGRWKELKSLNGKAGNELRVGSVIKLPTAPSVSTGAAGTTGATNEPASGGATHTVVKGETLADIARKHLGSSKQWRKIVEANPGVSPENLKVGQKLILPTGSSSSSSAVVSPAPATVDAPAASGDYVVQPGDTPRTIASKLLGSKNKAQAIIDANPGINPSNLRVGQKLKIPGAAASTPAPKPAAVPVAPAPAFPASPSAGGTAPGASPFQAAPSDFSSPYGAQQGFGSPTASTPAPAPAGQPSPFAETPVR